MVIHAVAAVLGLKKALQKVAFVRELKTALRAKRSSFWNFRSIRFFGLQSGWGAGRARLYRGLGTPQARRADPRGREPARRKVHRAGSSCAAQRGRLLRLGICAPAAALGPATSEFEPRNLAGRSLPRSRVPKQQGFPETATRGMLGASFGRLAGGNISANFRSRVVKSLSGSRYPSLESILTQNFPLHAPDENPSAVRRLSGSSGFPVPEHFPAEHPLRFRLRDGENCASGRKFREVSGFTLRRARNSLDSTKIFPKSVSPD